MAPPVTAAVGSPEFATLKLGREMFVYRCTSCHAIDPPSQHPIAFWQRTVEEMAGRAKLQPPEKSALLAYLARAR